MTRLLEIKDRVFRFCREYETYLRFVYKFIIALIMFCLINARVGFMESISSFPIALLLSLICSILPLAVTLLVAAVVVVLNLYVLSFEVAITALLIFALVFFVYFRFSPKDGLLFLLTPICFAFHIPYILPIGAGLFKKIYSVTAVLSGTVVYFFLDGIYQNVTALQTTTAGAEEVETIKMTISAGQLLANKEMYITVAVFLVSAIVVYTVRNMAIDHAWKVAVFSGATIQFAGMFTGYLVFDISGKLLGLVLGNLVAFGLGMLLEFLFMDLDYDRTERVQFEDDEYYYFVKAVPKKMVASYEKEVIQFGEFSPLNKIKDKKKKKEKEKDDSVSRKQIAKELEIDEELLK